MSLPSDDGGFFRWAFDALFAGFTALLAWVFRSHLRDHRDHLKAFREHEEDDRKIHAAENEKADDRHERLIEMASELDGLRAATVDLKTRASAERVEVIASRVHELSSVVGAASILGERVRSIEDRQEKSKNESGDLRVQVAELKASFTQVSTGLLQGNVRIESRMDRIEMTLEKLSDRLLNRNGGTR